MLNNNDELDCTGSMETANDYGNRSLGRSNLAFDKDGPLASGHRNRDPGPAMYLRMDKSSCQLPSIPTHETNGTVSTPVKPIRPDYEELSNCIRNQDELNVYTHIDDGSIIVGAGPFRTPNGMTTINSKQHLVLDKNGDHGRARRRSNPLYDYPPGYFSGQYSAVGQKQTTGTCCCYALQILGFLLSIAAFVLAIISIVTDAKFRTNYEQLVGRFDEMNARGCNDSGAWFGSSDANSIVQQLLQNYSELQQEIDSLRMKLDSLQTLFVSQQIMLQNLTFQLAWQTNQINQLNTEDANLSNTVDIVRMQIDSQIKQMSRGLANFSACSHQSLESGTSVYLPQSSTDPLNLNNTVVLSVVCSTDGGTQAFLQFDRKSPNVYTCVCRGQLYSNTTSRFCTIHYWTCPILP